MTTTDRMRARVMIGQQSNSRTGRVQVEGLKEIKNTLVNLYLNR